MAPNPRALRQMVKEAIEVTTFWKEMSPLLTKILGDPENAGLINQIDAVVKEFCDYDWEYGPSKNERFYFCLSPAWQEKYIGEIDDIILSAPKLEGWEFISCKPRKADVLGFLILNERDEEVSIQTENWKCVVYKFQDQTVDLDVMVDGINGDRDTQYHALNIHLTNLLGERNYLRIVKNVNIVSEFSEKDSPRSLLINELFDVLKRHLSLKA
jgi:hypothetical protein